MMIENGELVVLIWTWNQPVQVGIVVSSHMYTGNRWYRVRWPNGKVTEVAEIELQPLKEDRK